MKKIELANNSGFIFVDDEDFDFLDNLKWHKSSCGSACTYINEKRTFISNLILTEDKEVDHINRNRLDNRKSNLRYCTRQENQRNRGKFKNCASIFKGAQRVGTRNLWRSRIVVDGEKKSLGYFKTDKEAGMAYDSAAKKYFGQFALTNASLGLI